MWGCSSVFRFKNLVDKHMLRKINFRDMISFTKPCLENGLKSLFNGDVLDK